MSDNESKLVYECMRELGALAGTAYTVEQAAQICGIDQGINGS